MVDDVGLPREIDLREYLQVLRRRRGTILLIVVLAAGVALALSALQTPEYEATTQVVFNPSTTGQGNGQQSQPATDRATELLLLAAPDVSDAAARQLGHQPNVSAQSVGMTNVIAITARSKSASGAARDANAYARAYIDVRTKQANDQLVAAQQALQTNIQQLDARVSTLDAAAAAAGPTNQSTVAAEQASERSSIATQRNAYSTQLDQLQVATAANATARQVVARASVPGSPVKPTTARNLLLAIVVGLVLGVGVAFLREHFDDRVRTKDDVEQAADGLPVVAMIPLTKSWKHRKSPQLVSAASPRSEESEAYRTLRTSLQFLSVSRPMRSLQITSPTAVEGKTTTVANLALQAARAGRRVLVVGGDLRRPRVHEFFGLTNERGLTSVLLGDAALMDVWISVDGEPNLTVLPAGAPAPNPAELLSLPRAVDVIKSLRDRFDLVIIDTPPVLPVTDALVVSGLVDATLIVATAGVTTKHSLRSTVELLRRVHAPLVGTVLNCPPGSGRGYGYDYAYDDVAQAASKNGGRRRRDRKRSPAPN